MIEDKLTQDQRIRLECLAQSNAVGHGQSAEQIVHKAKVFEKYVRGDDGTTR